MEISAPLNKPALMQTSSPIDPAIPLSGPTQTSMQTSQYNSLQASIPDKASISRRTHCAGFIEQSAHTSMMSNTSEPLPNHTSMETLEEFPCHRSFVQTLTASFGVDDFSANSANSCAFNVMIKKEGPSACRNECPIRRIEKSSTSHEVAFCKRRNGLFNKAHELSVLCDAEVAAIVFSPSGKVSEFASSSMSHIIKRYESFQPQMSSNNVQLQDVEGWKRQAISLNTQIKRIQDFQRCVFENNDKVVSINEGENLESMLEHALDKIRKRKVELFEMQTHKIIEKGEIFCKKRNVLKEKECASNASSGWKEFCYDQDSVNTKLQLGLDTQEENSYSSKK